jgi:hypothetical protein
MIANSLATGSILPSDNDGAASSTWKAVAKRELSV